MKILKSEEMRIISGGEICKCYCQNGPGGVDDFKGYLPSEEACSDTCRPRAYVCASHAPDSPRFLTFKALQGVTVGSMPRDVPVERC